MGYAMPVHNYELAVEAEPDPDGIGRLFYWLKVNGEPVVCALGEGGEAFRNAQLLRLQLEEQLDHE